MDFSKIGKAIGKVSEKASKAGGKVAAFHDDAKTGLKWADKTFLNKGKADESTIYSHVLGSHARSLKKRYVVGGMAALGITSYGKSSIESRNVAKMGGRIQAGQGMANMTDTVKLSPGIQKLQKGENIKFNNSIDNAGADGSIVFAMHNMR